MSTFACKVTRIKAIEPIENADVIELAVVGDYRSVVRKGDFHEGDLAVYIPEGSVLPELLIEQMGLTGKLAGKQKNRVKAVRLRGCLSQGLLMPVYYQIGGDYFFVMKNTLASIEAGCAGPVCHVQEGDDLANFLDIIKYEPPIPAYMSGEVYGAGLDITLSYDIENFKAWPDVLVAEEPVVFTEKLHGTFCGVVILPHKDQDDKHIHRKFLVFSKGLGSQGLCFKDNEQNRGNVYFRALANSNIFEKLEILVDPVEEYDSTFWDVPVFLLGEVYGRGVQDLAYGTNDVHFRAFELAVGYRSTLEYINVRRMRRACEAVGIETVPILYQGPFRKEIMKLHTEGLETVSGLSHNIREGIVMRPFRERYDSNLGRVILKSVSEDYLLRKGDTTEYQ